MNLLVHESEPRVPATEVARLKALKDYDILDTPQEQEFEDIVFLASQICETPVALISLIDEHRQWFKAKRGISVEETPRNDSFCAHGILEPDFFEVNDARKDERFVDNPMVTGAERIRFYAGAPLVNSDGHAVGMVCVKDRAPRKLTSEQKKALQALSRQVVTQMELRKNLRELQKTIENKKQAEARLEEIHQKLLETSRRAGMAEVASSVLHNVGNVLNSVNVSSSLIAEKIRNSKVVNVTKIASLLNKNADDLAHFFTQDSRGLELPAYLENLASFLAEEQDDILHEVGSLVSNVLHIREIVAMQQNYATSSGLLEDLNPIQLIEDSLSMTREGMLRHKIEVLKEFEVIPTMVSERHKIIQILVNLIRNAKQACAESDREDKQITIKIRGRDDQITISIQDNGVGIPAENLTRIFQHGFTTRKGGHGFGLHSSALAAKDLGGCLRVSSNGPGEGAVFSLELPLKGGNK